MSEDIRHRVSVDDQAERASQQQGRLRMTVGRLGRAVGGMVSSWLGFTAIVGTVIAGMRPIRRDSKEATRAVADLGNQLGDLCFKKSSAGRPADNNRNISTGDTTKR